MGRSLPLRLISFAFRSVKALLLLGLLAGAGLFIWKTLGDQALIHRYRPVASGAPTVRELESETRDGVVTKLMELQGEDGVNVPFRIRYPDGARSKTLGCLVINYGIGQNLRFFDRIAHLFDSRNLVVIMPEQYDCGVRRKRERPAWQRIFTMRERPSRLVSETRLLLDYAQTLPFVNPYRMDYMGISFGGIVGCTLLAQEPRLKSATLVMSGGELEEMITGLAAQYRPESKAIWPAAAKFASWWVAPFEPLDHVGAFPQERLLFLQVEPDELIPLTSRKALYENAPGEKEERVYPGPHNRPTDQTIARMITDSLDWMGYRIPEPETETPALPVSEPVEAGGDPALPPE